MPDNQPTEREQYIESLENKLRKAGRAKRFQGSEDGALITEWVTQQVNAIVKGLAGRKFIDDHNGYVYETGQLAFAQKILTMLQSEAATDTSEIKEKLKEAKSDG